jgi:hypothetical protein
VALFSSSAAAEDCRIYPRVARGLHVPVHSIRGWSPDVSTANRKLKV